MSEKPSLVAQLIIDRTKALVAIQELHKSMNHWPDYVLCSECSGGHGDYVAYPCTTRQLADKGLEGERG